MNYLSNPIFLFTLHETIFHWKIEQYQYIYNLVIEFYLLTVSTIRVTCFFKFIYPVERSDIYMIFHILLKKDWFQICWVFNRF